MQEDALNALRAKKIIGLVSSFADIPECFYFNMILYIYILYTILLSMTFRDISYILLIKLVISMVLGIFDVIGVGLKQEKARK